MTSKDAEYYKRKKQDIDAQHRSYYEKNKEKVKARVRKYYAENKEKIKNKQNEKRRKEHPPKEVIIRTPEEEKEFRRDKDLKKKFGITLKDYNKMRFEQDGCCYICGRHEDEFPLHQLYVDHDHKTSRVRKLICNNCNSILGHARDDINVLYKAIAYLKLFR